MLLKSLTASAAICSAVVASYAPTISPCPADIQLVQKPEVLSQDESNWTRGRKSVAAEAFAAYLDRVQLQDFEVETYKSKIQQNPETNMPTLAMANSGGGWRSAFTSLGGLRAFDDKFPASVEQKTGGLLQSLTYYAGLSGGSWPVASLALYDYPAVDDLGASWKVNVNRISATNDSQSAATITTMFKQLVPMFEAGFNVSAMDLIGRIIGYEFVPGANGGLHSTWSSVAQLSNFKNFSGPMPVLQANSIDKNSPMFDGVWIAAGNGTIYEWTPFEFGSFDVGYTPTKYVGSKLNSHGNATDCVEGLDRSSFVLGTVASAYNAWYLAVISNNTLGHFSKRNSADSTLARRDTPFEWNDSPFTLEEIKEFDGAFEQYLNLSRPSIMSPSLPVAFSDENVTFADDSEALQSIAFWPLIQPSRHVDFIMAWDDDVDSAPYGWNNGTNMYNTYKFAEAAGLSFPLAPLVTTFLSRNYTTRPTFFGCNSSLTTNGNDSSPIVLYMANAPYSWYSNFSWTASSMSYAEFDGVMENGFNLVTQGNSTLDSDWPACIACAAIERSLGRLGMERSDQCERCFAKYCWDGTEDQITEQVLNPSLILEPSYGFVEWNKTHPYSS